MEEQESAGCKVQGKQSCHVPCFKCWTTRVPPSWLVVCAAIFVQVHVDDKESRVSIFNKSVFTNFQVGFGLYPVIVKKFAGDDHVNAYIFSFYRCDYVYLFTTVPHCVSRGSHYYVPCTSSCDGDQEF